METFLLVSSFTSLHFRLSWSEWFKKIFLWAVAEGKWGESRQACWLTHISDLFRLPGWPFKSSFLLPPSLGLLNQTKVAFAHWASWARTHSQEGMCAELSCVYLPLGVAAVAGWLCGLGRAAGRVQLFVISWFMTRLPHLLDNGLAFFPHRVPDCTKGTCEAGHCSLTHLPLCYPLKTRDTLRSPSFLKISGWVLF